MEYGKCKDCEFWKEAEMEKNGINGECYAWSHSRFQMAYPYANAESKEDQKLLDNMALEISIRTHPYFGCIQFESKEV